MTTGDQLFAAVRAAPEDEALRLVYADWLEEQGDPRAEFIRVQCALAKLPIDAPERLPLETREGDLLRQHIEQFRPPRLTGVDWGSFYLGFVDRCRFQSLSDFVAKAAEAFELAPLRTIRIVNVASEAEEAAFTEMVRRFEPLERLTEWAADFNAHWLGPPAGRNALLASPHCTGLRRIRQQAHSALTEVDPLTYLLDGPTLPHLTELSLVRMAIQDESLEALARSSRFPALQTLDLSRSRELRMVGILGSMRAELRQLNLTEVVIPLHELGELLAGPATARLEELNLSYTLIGGAGVVRLAKAPCRETLRDLRLSGAGADYGFAETTWPALEELTLDKNAVGLEGAKALARANLPRLSRFSLESCELRDGGAMALAQLRARSLTELNLSQNGIGPEGLVALAESAVFRSLRNLSLKGNPIGAEGALMLAKTHALEHLQELKLNLEDVGERNVDALRALHLRFPFWRG